MPTEISVEATVAFQHNIGRYRAVHENMNLIHIVLMKYSVFKLHFKEISREDMALTLKYTVDKNHKNIPKLFKCVNKNNDNN